LGHCAGRALTTEFPPPPRTLTEASGAVVGKDVLLDRVWPGTIVEENRLQNQVSALRRAFGADQDLIRTVAGRGYQFT
jgi:DNA-binding winged helix-turn-helix (wHTH) protein